MHLQHELFIAAPVDTVWNLTIDVESWPTVTPTMSSIVRVDSGSLRIGSQATVKQPGQGKKVWTVSRMEPMAVFEWGTKMLGAKMVGGHHLSAVDGGCKNTLTLDLTGPGAGLLGRIAGKKILAAITTENEGFKRAAESAAA